MSEPINPPETPAEATGTAPEAPKPETQERTFTAKEVESIVRDRLARAKKEPKVESKAAPTEETKPTNGTDIATLKLRQDFLEAVADMDWKPSKEDRELLWGAFQHQGPETMQTLATKFKPPSTTSAAAAPTEPPAPTGPGYKSPGAPAGAPPEVLDRDATKWSKDYIDRMREQGTFLTELEKYRGSLPGGGNGLFRRRIPSK